MGKYRIISFDGGGVRGALTATLLLRLAGYFPELLQGVDLFAGTSTGSFIALGLAYGYKPWELVQLYSLETGRYIFTPRYINLSRPRYNSNHLARILNRVFPAGLRLGDLPKKVVIPSFRVNSSGSDNWSPTFFHNFPNSPYLDCPVVDVALASSAAPTYFPSSDNQIDGGMIANNPSTAAVAFAASAECGSQSLGDICLLSMGTGESPSRILGDTSLWGIIQWAFNSSPPPEVPLLTILTDGVVEADSQLTGHLLGSRHFRLNPPLAEIIPLDNYKQIPHLIKLAEDYNLTYAVDWLKTYWAQ